MRTTLRKWTWAGWFSILVLGGCEPQAAPTVPGGTGPPVLAEAQGGCFHWPQAPFSPRNFAETEISLGPGDRALDFTLRDLEGESHTLSRLLEERPVVLILGSFT